MSGSQFIELFVGGLAIGCIYSLIALGFTMITDKGTLWPRVFIQRDEPELVIQAIRDAAPGGLPVYFHTSLIAFPC